jgi:hypothetical protein
VSASQWPMWAHNCNGEYQHIGERWWVEIHGLPDPVEPVLVTLVPDDSPDGTHWGWIDADGRDDGKPVMIWAFRGAFDMQFPYGPKAEVEAGKGRIVRLRITTRKESASP